MHVQILTIFPELFEPFLTTSLMGRAVEEGLLDVQVEDLRRFTTDRHRSVDDEPYGGGGGMVMTAQPWIDGVTALAATVPEASGTATASTAPAKPKRILMSPQGSPLNEAKVRELAGEKALVLLCGRYEAIDERVLDSVVDEEISIGDYVLSGGELPAMVLVEAVSRQIPGVVGLADSVENVSFRDGLLDFPHYTRPRDVAGRDVPEILLSGDHARIDAWRRQKSLEATLRKRPDLLPRASLSKDDLQTLEQLVQRLGLEWPEGLQRPA